MGNLLRYPVTYCVVGIGLAWWDPIHESWWGLVVLGALISLYGFLAKGDRDDRRIEVGDNCYFIGFVYTLSIITVSLIQADDLLAATPKLLYTVGIALGTSVVGMVWRFGLVHGVRVEGDAFHEAVREAAVAAASLKGVVAELAKAVEGAAEAVDAQTAASTRKLDELVEAARSRMNNAAAAAGDVLQKLGEQTGASLRQQATTLAELAGGTSEALDNLRQTTKAATEEIAQSLTATSSALRGYARTVETAAHRAGDALAAGAREALDQVSSGLSDALQANTFADVRRGMEAAVKTHQQAVAELRRKLGESVGGLSEATALATTRAEEARQTLIAANSALDRAGLDAVPATVAALRDAVTALNQQLPALAAAQAGATNAAASYRRELESLRDTLRQMPPAPAAEHRGPERRSFLRRFCGR